MIEEAVETDTLPFLLRHLARRNIIHERLVEGRGLEGGREGGREGRES